MEPTRKRERRAHRFWLAACLGMVLLAAPRAPVPLAQDPEPTPTTDRLAPPEMPADPGQADQGAMVYYQICMACHGDQGQGLTDEFRAVWSEGDQNCWQSKCHAANHPPSGFELVRYVPPVVGESVMAHYETAADLYAYVRSRMPWHDPGGLTEEEYWQVTAFLLRANGVEIGQEVLGPENAAGVSVAAAARGEAPALPQVAPPEMPPPDATSTNWVAIAGVAVAVAAAVGLLVAWVLWRRKAR